MWEPKTFQIWDVLSVLLKDFAHWRQEQIPVELPMEAPRSHSQDTAYELLHTVDPGTEIPRPLLVDLNKSRILQPLFYPWVHTQIFCFPLWLLPTIQNQMPITQMYRESVENRFSSGWAVESPRSNSEILCTYSCCFNPHQRLLPSRITLPIFTAHNRNGDHIWE